MPPVESLSHGCAVPAPFGKGAFGVHRPKPPLPKGGASAPPRRGDKRPSGFHMGSYFGKVPPVESLSHGYAVPAPFGKGAFGVHRRSPPWPLWGCLGLPRRGDSVAKATDFFPIPSSLFPKIARYRYRGINKAGTESVPAFWLWNFRSESSGSWQLLRSGRLRR